MLASRTGSLALLAGALLCACGHEPTPHEIAEERREAIVNGITGEWASYDGSQTLYLDDEMKATLTRQVPGDDPDLVSKGRWVLDGEVAVISVKGAAGDFDASLKSHKMDPFPILVPSDDAPVSRCYFYIEPEPEPEPPDY